MVALSLSSLGKLSVFLSSVCPSVKWDNNVCLTGVMQQSSICKTLGMYLADVYERMVLVEVEAKCRSWGLVKILSVGGC